MVGESPAEVSNSNRLFSQTQPVHLELAAVRRQRVEATVYVK